MSAPPSSSPRFTNRLAHEKSPYLLQHAHNPVDWYPWGTDALETAKRDDKPIFLSVGYSACHWCHVMERESFEDENAARLLNENFVCIKVDREERPDVDEIYMTAVQRMTGHGGWPMSVFLTPDGRPFYGGTYFPPEGRHNRPGFKSLVSQLADVYHNRREEVERVASEMAEDLQEATRQRPLAGATGAPDAMVLLRAAVADLAERYDRNYGGFGPAPKFPPHHALRLLCEAARNGDAEALPLLTGTLDRMALGGIYDHIGGGFHRYSTDGVWLLPHFEKMLYDNALLARVYADAYVVTGKTAYARIVRETCDWMLRDLLDEGGGLQAALDADSEGEEGKYYVWAKGEIDALLGDRSPDFRRAYNILPGGNFHDEATGQSTGTNIPHLSVQRTAPPLPDALTSEAEAARAALLARRYERIPPGKDDKVITSWNGLAIGALAYAGRVLNEPRYTEAARRAADFCLSVLRPDGKLLRRYAKGEAGLPAFLDDYGYLADGLLDLFDVTAETRYRSAAKELADTMLSDFWDEEDGGFFFAGREQEQLVARSKDMLDGALPSANGVAARVLARLAHLPGDERYGEAANALFTAYGGLVERFPQGTQTLIGAAHLLQKKPKPNSSFNPVSLEPEENVVPLRIGERGEAVFVLKIAEGYHINARRPDEKHLTPTEVELTLTSDMPAIVGPLVLPPETMWQDESGNTLRVYMATVRITIPVALAAAFQSGTGEVRLTVRCQACGQTECLAPVELTASLFVTVPQS